MSDSQVRIITAPTVEPVTLAEAKVDLRVDHTDDDTLITALIVAGRQRCEELANRALINRTLEMALCEWPCNAIALPYPPLVSVTSVTYYDEDNSAGTMSSSDYIAITDVEPGLIALARDKSWPDAALRPQWPIRVRWVAGCGATAASVPETWKHLIRAWVAIRYEFRDEMTPQGATQLARIEGLMRWGTSL